MLSPHQIGGGILLLAAAVALIAYGMRKTRCCVETTEIPPANVLPGDIEIPAILRKHGADCKCVICHYEEALANSLIDPRDHL